MSRLRRITSKAQEPDIETTPRNRDYSSSFADVHLQPLKRELELETMLLSQSPVTSAGHASIGRLPHPKVNKCMLELSLGSSEVDPVQTVVFLLRSRQLFPIASPWVRSTQGSAKNCGSPASESCKKSTLDDRYRSVGDSRANEMQAERPSCSWPPMPCLRLRCH